MSRTRTSDPERHTPTFSRPRLVFSQRLWLHLVRVHQIVAGTAVEFPENGTRVSAGRAAVFTLAHFASQEETWGRPRTHHPTLLLIWKASLIFRPVLQFRERKLGRTPIARLLLKR